VLDSRVVIGQSALVQLSQALEMIGRIASIDPRVREVGADEVTDVLGALDDDSARLFALVLVLARLAETERAAREAQLNALVEISNLNPLPMAVVDRLRQIATPTGDPSQDEHLAYLLDSPHLRQR
jgi:hypothetical protein